LNILYYIIVNIIYNYIIAVNDENVFIKPIYKIIKSYKMQLYNDIYNSLEFKYYDNI
jgi:hypothetical protein